MGKVHDEAAYSVRPTIDSDRTDMHRSCSGTQALFRAFFDVIAAGRPDARPFHALKTYGDQ